MKWASSGMELSCMIHLHSFDLWKEAKCYSIGLYGKKFKGDYGLLIQILVHTIIHTEILVVLLCCTDK
jgi:hypothetical protein